MPIQSFACTDTETLFRTGSVPKFVSIEIVATRKLAMLNSATNIRDLKSPPGNRLHQLERDRAGQYSISINEQFRICFIWSSAGPEDVEITDYH